MTALVVGVVLLAATYAARDAWVRWLADRAAARVPGAVDAMAARVAALERALGDGDAGLPRRVLALERGARAGARAR